METFLFTDIAGSTSLWQAHPRAMSEALRTHNQALETAVTEAGGEIVKFTGDGVLAAFDQGGAAVQTAVEIQRRLAASQWPETGPLLVRIGMHTGDAEARDGDYYGTSVNRAARVMGLAHGGQILATDATRLIVEDAPPEGLGFRPLGEYRLKGLEGVTAVHQVVHPDLAGSFPPLRGGADTPNNLPAKTNRFIGRERETARILDALLGDSGDPSRLVTLIGPGGTGKTRLSIRAAREALEGFPDGVWLIELAPLADPERIPHAALEVLELRETADMPAVDLLTTYLGDKQCLLVFDNCEHLVDASAALIETVLRSAPLVRVLASSREALGIYGETVLRIPSLPLPPREDGTWEAVRASEAVQLFIIRAEAAAPGGFNPEEHGREIAEICRRLDGIPFAIELAAARLRVFTPGQILARLDDRFRLLTGGSRTALPRLQTLQALIDWSYGLLSDEEKRLFMDLSVFAGGWTVEMAEAVCPEVDVLTLLPQLVEKSLATAEPGEGGMRYGYLETMRQFARDRLLESGRSAEVRDRHARYFVERSAWNEIFTYAGVEKILISAWPELDNFRSALTWSLESDPLSALELVGNLVFVWGAGPVQEGLRWVEQALAKVEAAFPGDPLVSGNPRLVRALAVGYVCYGFMVFVQGRNERALEIVQPRQALAEAAGDKMIETMYWSSIATGSTLTGRAEAGQVGIERGLALASEMGSDLFLSAFKSLHATYKVFFARDIPGARDLLDEVARYVPVNRFSFSEMFALVKIESILGNWDKARELVAQATEAADRSFILDRRRIYTNFIAERAHIERQSGNLDAAQHFYSRAIRRYAEFGMAAAAANVVECFAMIAVKQGRAQRAAALFGAAEAVRKEIGADMTPLERMEYMASVGTLRGMLDPEALGAAWADGGRKDLDRAIAFAADYAGPGDEAA